MKRRVCPPLHWPVLAVLCAMSAGCSRPAPPAAGAPASAVAVVPLPRSTTPAAPREPGPYESARPIAAHEPTPLPDLSEVAASEPAPKAGRQVLRCTDKGRITYIDLNASCLAGPGERVTVFPTEGVEKPH